MSYDELRKGRVSRAGQIYFVTTVTLNRRPFFADFRMARMVVTEMRRLDEEGLVRSIAWVLMPEHLHWLMQIGETQELSKVVKLFKARSARQINRTLQRKGSVWQRAYYDHAIRKEENIHEIAKYIIANPLRRGLVSGIEKYSFWDMAWNLAE